MTKLWFVRREYWGADVWEYFFQPEAQVKYLAGQYASFSIPGIKDARGIARTFTMTSLATDTLLSFAVKITDAPSPYKVQLNRLQPRDSILMGEPMGDLIMPRTATTPLLFVAGGLGVASYVALLRMNRTNPFSLLWAVRNSADQYNLPVLRSLETTNRYMFAAPNRLNVDDILQRAAGDTLIYLSGSERFVSSLRSDLHACGITDARILFDYFSGYNEL